MVCSLSTLDEDALTMIFANLGVRSVCQMAASCRKLRAFVKENNYVKKTFKEQGISFEFVGHRYVEDQNFYVFDHSVILNGLRTDEEIVQGVITCRKHPHPHEDRLLVDVQVRGASVQPVNICGIVCSSNKFYRMGMFKSIRHKIKDCPRLSLVIFGRYLRLKVFNGKYRASYLLDYPLYLPRMRDRGESLMNFPLSMVRAYKACVK